MQALNDAVRLRTLRLGPRFSHPLTHRADAATPTTLLKERVAQLVEHLTFNQEVMGSNPIALTNKIKWLHEIRKY